MPPARKKGGKGGTAAGESRLGDLVLAKVKGFPPWPAKISRPEDWNRSPEPRKHFVQFFGIEEIAFVAPADIQVFTNESKSRLSARCQSKTVKYFALAVKQISEAFEKLHEKGSDEHGEDIDSPAVGIKSSSSGTHKDGRHLDYETSCLEDQEEDAKLQKNKQKSKSLQKSKNYSPGEGKAVGARNKSGQETSSGKLTVESSCSAVLREKMSPARNKKHNMTVIEELRPSKKLRHVDEDTDLSKGVRKSDSSHVSASEKDDEIVGGKKSVESPSASELEAHKTAVHVPENKTSLPLALDATPYSATKSATDKTENSLDSMKVDGAFF